MTTESKEGHEFHGEPVLAKLIEADRIKALQEMQANDARYRWILENANVLFHVVQSWASPEAGRISSRFPISSEISLAIDSAMKGGAQ